jgi:hypothetical protein
MARRLRCLYLSYTRGHSHWALAAGLLGGGAHARGEGGGGGVIAEAAPRPDAQAFALHWTLAAGLVGGGAHARGEGGSNRRSYATPGARGPSTYLFRIALVFCLPDAQTFYFSTWLGWKYLTQNIQSKQPRPSSPPSNPASDTGKMGS